MDRRHFQALGTVPSAHTRGWAKPDRYRGNIVKSIEADLVYIQHRSVQDELPR